MENLDLLLVLILIYTGILLIINNFLFTRQQNRYEDMIRELSHYQEYEIEKLTNRLDTMEKLCESLIKSLGKKGDNK